MKKKRIPIIPAFLDMRGCPGSCVFCDQKMLTGVGNQSDAEIKAGIIRKVRELPENSGFELAFYGGTFTGLPSAAMHDWLSWAGTLAGLQKIRISTRPDLITDEILDILSKKGVNMVELGIQSFNNKVLESTRRGYDRDTAIKACRAVKNAGFRLGIQLMPGLPGESPDDFPDTVSTTLECGPDIVRIYPAVILRGTGLEKMFHSGTYSPLPLEQAVKISARSVIRLRNSRIRVIRIGLRSLKDPSSVVAGPYHPQFKYMVESRILLINILSVLEGKKASRLEISGHPDVCHYISGFRKTNLESIRLQGYPVPVIRQNAGLPCNILLINGMASSLSGWEEP